jgi:integrase
MLRGTIGHEPPEGIRHRPRARYQPKRRLRGDARDAARDSQANREGYTAGFRGLARAEYGPGMARLYRRGKKGTFWFQLNNKRRSTGTSDRKAAELFVAQLERRAADPTYRAPDGTTLSRSLKTFYGQQLERGRAEGTLKMYDTHAAHLCRVLGEETPIASLSAEELDGYVSARRGEGAQDPTIHKELTTLRGTLKLARRHRKYPFALDEVMPQISGASKPGKRHLLLGDVMALLRELPIHRAAVVAFIVATGADWASVVAAKKGDVNLRAGTILVRGTKNNHRWRTLPILAPFRELVQVATNNLPFSPWGNVRRDLAVACGHAGVTKVTPRDLRRSHGTILTQAGVEPHLVGKMLGHADSRMVDRVYGQMSVKALGALVSDRLGTTSVQVKANTPKKRRKKAA